MGMRYTDGPIGFSIAASVFQCGNFRAKLEEGGVQSRDRSTAKIGAHASSNHRRLDYFGEISLPYSSYKYRKQKYLSVHGNWVDLLVFA